MFCILDTNHYVALAAGGPMANRLNRHAIERGADFFISVITPQEVLLRKLRRADGLVFSPDGKLLAASLTDGTVLQLEVPSLRELKRWQPRTGPSRVLGK